MPFASIGATLLGWAKKVPDIVWWIVIGVIFWKWTEISSYRRGANDTNAKRDKEAAEVESEVVSQITENSNALQREADAVRSHSAVRELPDGTQALPEYHYRD